MSPKIYIHELIDIIGHNRARYLHHMTANWCPIAREERNQLCLGVWATLGSTGRWPEVVNMWELDGWDGLAANFAHETAGGRDQDPSLAEWWSVAASLRRAGRKPAARAYDAMIAAIALANGLPVHTCNPDDFAGIDGLTVIAVPYLEG